MENKLSSAELFAEIVKSGIKYSNHESDLYIPANPETIALLSRYEFKSNVTQFNNQVEGGLWFDIPFAFMPFWEKSRREPRGHVLGVSTTPQSMTSEEIEAEFKKSRLTGAIDPRNVTMDSVIEACKASKANTDCSTLATGSKAPGEAKSQRGPFKLISGRTVIDECRNILGVFHCWRAMDEDGHELDARGLEGAVDPVQASEFAHFAVAAMNSHDRLLALAKRSLELLTNPNAENATDAMGAFQIELESAIEDAQGPVETYLWN